MADSANSGPDEAIVRVLLNEAYLKFTGVCDLSAGPIDADGARSLSLFGLEMLCDLQLAEDGGPGRVYQTLATVEPEALPRIAAAAVTELAEAGWRVPMLKCPKCGSENVETSSDDPDHDSQPIKRARRNRQPTAGHKTLFRARTHLLATGNRALQSAEREHDQPQSGLKRCFGRSVQPSRIAGAGCAGRRGARLCGLARRRWLGGSPMALSMRLA